jgi:hypothetical protein
MKIDDRRGARPPSQQPARPFRDLLESATRRGQKPLAPPARGPGLEKGTGLGKGKALEEDANLAQGVLQLLQGAREQSRTQLLRRGREQVAARAIAATEQHGATLARAHADSSETTRARVEQRAHDGLQERLLRELERLEPPVGEPRQTPDEARWEGRPDLAAAHAAPGVTGASSGEGPLAAPAPGARAEAIARLVDRIEAALRDGRPQLTLTLGGEAAAGRIEIARIARGEIEVRIDARAATSPDAEQLRQALEQRGLKVRAIAISRGGRG